MANFVPIKKFFWLAIFLAIFLKADSASAFTVGEIKNFNVETSYDYADRSAVKAILLQVGDKGLYYVDSEWWNGLNAVDAASNNLAILNLLGEFDKTIYPRLTKVYGSEWSPGIDNELRISILIMPLKKNTGGYFNSVDEFFKAQAPSSNEREILYLNSVYLDLPLMKVFLAHEFQHMINFYQKEKLRGLTEDIWLNEARSEYASTLAGYDNIYEGSNLQRRVNEFLRDSSDSLTEWQNQTADYGSINLFMQYLVSRYGEQILTKMVAADAIGIESVNGALRDMGFTETFDEIFTNWTVANFINDCNLGQGRIYCYLNSNLPYERLHVSPTLSNALELKERMVFSYTDEIKDWSGHWYEILPLGSGNLNLILNFSGSSNANFKVPFIVYYKDGIKVVRYLKIDTRQAGADFILNFGGQAQRVVLLLFSQVKTNSFVVSEEKYPFSYTFELTSATFLSVPVIQSAPIANLPVAPSTVPATSTIPDFPDGSLIRAKGDYRVFVVKGKYKRWLRSPEIFAAYPHLNWQSIIEVTPAERDWYRDSWLIRVAGDARVYEINGDGTKHWINMSAEKFVISGRAWGMVYIVNQAEVNLYRTGAEALK